MLGVEADAGELVAQPFGGGVAVGGVGRLGGDGGDAEEVEPALARRVQIGLDPVEDGVGIHAAHIGRVPLQSQVPANGGI